MNFAPADSLLYAALLILGYSIFCLVIARRYRARHPAPRLTHHLGESDTAWLVAYASQTGTAEQIARQTAAQFEQAGMSVVVASLNQITLSSLPQFAGVLFVVSTYGEGEPPDNGNRFLSRLPGVDLTGVRYGLLALGDSDYTHYCGFAYALNQQLQTQGAQALFDVIDVNRRDESALRHWQYYLGQLSGNSEFSDWSAPQYEPWVLSARECINPGSLGAPAFFLQLRAQASMPIWQAGDIAEIGPCNSDARVQHFVQQLSLLNEAAQPLADAREVTEDSDILSLLAPLKRKNLPQQTAEIAPLTLLGNSALLAALNDLPHREYSIASTPQQGSLDLLVRQQPCSINGFGLGSGWLTHHAAVGDTILLRIRSNPHFHTPAAATPLILIGNGTGIAGLRAHLLHRVAQGATRNWLLFGERSAAQDFFFAEQLQQWQAGGQLQRLDVVFSRDQTRPDAPRYVQDLLPPLANELRAWVAAGAAIYVCGSLQGMAQGVDNQLAAILGREQLEQLQASQRYCRDVY